MAKPKKVGEASEPSRPGKVTFRRYITLRNGRVLDAHEYGHKAWPIGSKR